MCGRVELAIAAVPGVLKASVNLATERGTIEAAAPVPAAAVEAAIRQAGYVPRLANAAGASAAADARQEAKDREL
ncbi:cation transporter, partial [Tianweitania sediminis]|nr:heavy-metal-associated domain-containing protein [Tianweitania sediminis]